ncbi:Disease resistance protein RPP8 [Glycine soja]|uniref:Disease resistance protein RPP8 n=1 Tax=Glycine soja TaxID=3848 RepID=A0A0B2R334_GLYSO|nr:Disease resistance protein RPP8 [Glycine soja]
MAETAVSISLEEVFQILKKETNLLRGIHKDFSDTRDELESIQTFLKDADRRAAADEANTNDGIRTWVKQVREASFRIEDVVYEYLRVIHVGTMPSLPTMVKILHFQSRGFPKLKQLELSRLNRVNSVVIEEGALVCLEHFTIIKMSHLKKVSSGIKALENLKVLDFISMPTEFVESIVPENGQDYQIINHVPLVFVRHWIGLKVSDYKVRSIHSSSKDS